MNCKLCKVPMAEGLKLIENIGSKPLEDPTKDQ